MMVSVRNRCSFYTSKAGGEQMLRCTAAPIRGHETPWRPDGFPSGQLICLGRSYWSSRRETTMKMQPS
eukprot:scaffold345_cov134-Cylindrotheca_fusiformis.AAC.63